MKCICSKLNTYLNYYYIKNNHLHKQLLSIIYKKEKITEYDQIKFKRNNREYITKEMKTNLGNNLDINQWFLDTTYYAIPRKNNDFKLLLLGFNIKINKTCLGTIMLIKNENQETFMSILKYLNINYKFEPQKLMQIAIKQK